MKLTSRLRYICATLAVCPLGISGAEAVAGETAVPAFSLPHSNQLSPEALVVLQRMAGSIAPATVGDDLERQRAFYQVYNDHRLAEMRAQFDTRETNTVIGGVPVQIVDPANGVPLRNRDRVLINVHGGAFKWGSGSGALVEAIPIAATMGVRVITVDYRLAPEHRYPAASIDVAAVYKALLADHDADSIGIYGCSAGGIITAQATAWIRKEGMPAPGAIGTFCGTGAPYSGDGPYLAGPLGGDSAREGVLPLILDNPYMEGVQPANPQAYPLLSEKEIRAMPPTLLLAGSRDFSVSALTLAHRQLTGAGVDSELQIFDGLPHAFFVWPDMPESREAYLLVTRFFEDKLHKTE